MKLLRVDILKFNFGGAIRQTILMQSVKFSTTLEVRLRLLVNLSIRKLED